jgi:hypothetical protein
VSLLSLIRLLDFLIFWVVEVGFLFPAHGICVERLLYTVEPVEQAWEGFAYLFISRTCEVVLVTR